MSRRSDHISTVFGPGERRTWRPLWIIATAVVSLSVSGCDREWDEVEIITGYEGEARTNPFLAAERFIGKMGGEAETKFVVAPFPDRGATMVLPAESVVGMGLANEIEEWIARGGHVIYLVGGADSARNDFNDALTEKPYEPPGDPDHALLEKFGIKVVSGGASVRQIKVGPEEFDCEMGRGSRLDFSEKKGISGRRSEMFQSGDATSAAFGSFPVRNGRLTILADAEIWRNSKIGENDHAAFLWKVLSLSRISYRGSEVRFILGVGTSFWGLLTHFAWMAIAGAALAVAVWLWKNLTRFGPPLQLEGDASRDFTDHVAVAGKFLWSKRRSDVLLGAARRRIRAALRRTHATLELESPETLDLVSASSNLTPERVRAALTAHGTNDGATMTRLTRDLQTIENSL